MNLSPPIPWRDVPVGAVVLLDGVPRTVLDVRRIVMGEHIPRKLYADLRDVFLEGIPARGVQEGDTVQLVMLDESDAVAILGAAGLNPEIIDTRES